MNTSKALYRATNELMRAMMRASNRAPLGDKSFTRFLASEGFNALPFKSRVLDVMVLRIHEQRKPNGLGLSILFDKERYNRLERDAGAR